MWEITKHFDFCYGHRVHTQVLDAELSCNTACKCRHLHGHQGKLKVSLSAPKLKDGMVTDFHHLNWLKSWIDDYFDHKMIFDLNDPYLLTILTSSGLDLTYLKPLFVCSGHSPYLYTVDDDRPNWHLLSLVQKEILEGITVVDFIPTSENLAKFVFDWVTAAMKKHCDAMKIQVTQVVFEETPKSSSTYRG